MLEKRLKLPIPFIGRAAGFVGMVVVAFIALVAFASCGGGGDSSATQGATTAGNSETISSPQTTGSATDNALDLDGTASTMAASDNSPLSSSELLPGEKNIEGLQVIPVFSADHVEYDVQYSTSPPAGGPHYGIWQNCGFYTVELLEELAVHSLEHGAVWITYRSDISSEDLGSLERLAERNNYLLVSPLEQQESEVVLTAWGRQLPLGSVGDSRFVEFLDTYLGTGPTTPEPGAVCFGGVGVAPDQPLAVPR